MSLCNHRLTVLKYCKEHTVLPQEDKSNFVRFDDWREQELLNSRNELIDMILSNLRDGRVVNSWVGSKMCKILLYGADMVRDEVAALWQNMIIVSSFVGSIAVSVLLTPIEKTDGFSDTANWYNMSTVYYVFWAFTAFSELVSLMLLVLMSIHLSYCIKDVDFLLFLMYHDDLVDIPETLITAGCVAMLVSCCVGSYQVANNTVGTIASFLAFVSLIVSVGVWLNMLKRNKGIRTAVAKKTLASFTSFMKPKATLAEIANPPKPEVPDLVEKIEKKSAWKIFHEREDEAEEPGDAFDV